MLYINARTINQKEAIKHLKMVLVNPENGCPPLYQWLPVKSLTQTHGFTCILPACMRHLHHDDTSMHHCSRRKIYQPLYFQSKLNMYLKQTCSFFQSVIHFPELTTYCLPCCLLCCLLCDLSAEFIDSSCCSWRPHEDSNLDLRLRRPPFYPVELWGLNSIYTNSFF